MTATPVDDYLRHLVVERGLARNTISSYRRDLAIYADWLASRGIAGPSAATEQDLGDFVRFLGADRVPPLAIAVLAAMVARARDWSSLGPADAPWPGQAVGRTERSQR